MTLEWIYALKRRDENTLTERTIGFLSEYSGTPIDYYDNETVRQFVRSSFIDYLRTADNPAFAVWQYFDCQKYHPDDTEALMASLLLAQVRDDSGYVNGFRDKEYVQGRRLSAAESLAML